MTDANYIAGIWALILINTLPQIAAVYLCWRWLHIIQRRWPRFLFHAAGLTISGLAIARLVTVLAFSHWLVAMFLAAAVGVAMGFVTIGVLWLCTHVIEGRTRRVAGDTAETPSTYVLLTGIADDLIALGRQKRWL